MMRVTRRHTIAAAHRLYEYGGQCERLHGHNYRIEVTLETSALDRLGMVMDFGDVKKILLSALDEAWDHKTLLYDRDPLSRSLAELTGDGSVVPVPFNPTAENMAMHLGTVMFPALLREAGFNPDVRVCSVTVFETDNNYARWSLDA